MFCPQLLEYCYFTVLWIHELNAVLLVLSRGDLTVVNSVTKLLFNTVHWVHGLSAVLLEQGRGEVTFLPAVISVLLHPKCSGYMD